MIQNFHWPDTPDRDPAEYPEKSTALAEWTERPWKDADKFPPPRLHEVIATDGRNVKEAWKSFDGDWMRINARWEFVFGTQVKFWMEKPTPPGRR